MTYTASEQSKHGGKPVELFRYVGTYQNFYYTSGQKQIEFQAPDEDAPNTYIPLAMRRSAVSQTTQNDDGAEITIELPVSTDIVAIYAFQISPPALELTLFRGHALDQMVQYWSGDVENIQVAKGTATIRVPSRLATALTADFPNVFYQGPCNHNLYDARCKVNPADWLSDTSITAVNKTAITVASIAGLDGKLVGGDAVLDSGERRMIISQTGNNIVISYPFAGAEVAGGINLLAGCDLARLGDCKNKFDNTINFGGFPFIPPKNIFQSGLEGGKDVADEACLPTYNDWTLRIRFDFTTGGTIDLGIGMNTGGYPQDIYSQVDGTLIGAKGGGTPPVFSTVYNTYDLHDGGPLASVFLDKPDLAGVRAPLLAYRSASGNGGSNDPAYPENAGRGGGGILYYEWFFFFPLSEVDRSFVWTHQFGAGGTYPGHGTITAVDGSNHILASEYVAYGHLWPYTYSIDY